MFWLDGRSFCDGSGLLVEAVEGEGASAAVAEVAMEEEDGEDGDGGGDDDDKQEAHRAAKRLPRGSCGVTAA